MDSEISNTRKLCFVTIGATATFDSLIEAVLSQPVLQALQDLGYTELLLQYGINGEKILEGFYNNSNSSGEYKKNIKISGFAFNKSGLGEEMKAAKGREDDTEGVVISHAGEYLESSLRQCVLIHAHRVRFYTRRSSHFRAFDCRT